MSIRIENLSKEYDLKTMGLTDVSLEVEDGGFLTVVGAPGSGKTTLLFCIGGLLNATSGKIYFGDRDMTNTDVRLRDVCLMREGQNPTKGTVYDNVSYGLRLRRLPAKTISERVRTATEILNLTDKLDVKINKLSELDRRRVSLARGLARQPELFLLDEPLFALDERDRNALAEDVIKAHDNGGITFILSGSQGEDAFLFGGKTAVMKDGRIVQTGTKYKLMNEPVNRFVASFAGDVPMNFIQIGSEYIGFRPNDATVNAEGEFKGRVVNVTENGLLIRINEHESPVTVITDYTAEKGDSVGVTPLRKITFDESGNAITAYK